VITTREIGLVLLELVAATLVLVPCAYLGALALISLLPRASSPEHPRPLTRLAVLVAAHDEEPALERTIAAIRKADGGEDMTVHVVADNCADRTAEVARRAGACVHERHDPTRPGKAAALNWLAAQVLAEDRTSDAFVVIDADARPEGGFLLGLRREVASGALVVQTANLVDVDRTAPLSLLRDLAFHLICELRPLAYQRLGLSAGLHGNGMCLVRPVLERYAWNERSVVEDGELHLRLVADGIKVRFAADAIVRSTMPVRFTEASGQAVRWERGSFDHFREGLRLIASGVRTHDVALVAAAYELAIPPLSFLFAAGLVSAGLGAALADTGLVVIGVAALLGCSVYVARGLSLARLQSRELLRIGLWLPAYVLWKLVIVVRAALGSGRGRWAQARPAPATVVQAGNSE
jgi:cellulose synthase/poly-beta-1,6-N-acetylglucosamine synthase-like glycosyltransferase